MENDGIDPRWKPGGGLASSTGRVGHIAELQLDAISLHYGIENKQMIVPGVLWGFWKKVVHRSHDQGKIPVLRWEPTNEEKYVEGVRIPTMHVITEERHGELLNYERLFNEKVEAAKIEKPVTITPYSKEQQLRGRTSKRPRRN